MDILTVRHHGDHRVTVRVLFSLTVHLKIILHFKVNLFYFKSTSKHIIVIR